MSDETDAVMLRAAETILRRESKRPRSIVLAAMCNVLNGLADKLQDRARRQPVEAPYSIIRTAARMHHEESGHPVAMKYAPGIVSAHCQECVWSAVEENVRH